MIRIPMTLNEDEMRLITAYNEMKQRANGKQAQLIARIVNGNLQLFEAVPVTEREKRHIDNRQSVVVK